MDRFVVVVNLGTSAYFIVNILLHLIRPGANTGYTRMLMFACLASIPLIFMMMFIGGYDRWPMLVAEAKTLAAGSFSSKLILAGVIVLLILLPLGILLAAWNLMGLRFGLLFILYLIPGLSRLVLTPVDSCIKTSLIQILLFFAAFFIGIGIHSRLERFASGTATYHRHLQAIWPGYRDAAKLFFSVCVFALLIQLTEFSHALRSLLVRQW